MCLLLTLLNIFKSLASLSHIWEFFCSTADGFPTCPRGHAGVPSVPPTLLAAVDVRYGSENVPLLPGVFICECGLVQELTIPWCVTTMQLSVQVFQFWVPQTDPETQNSI